MSITTDNEMSRLFSTAFGEDWMRAGLTVRSKAELESIQKIASDHVSQALNQIEAIGRTMGAADAETLDANSLGWTLKSIAENANVCNELKDLAECLQSNKYREAFKIPPIVG
jgi:hypothetical protein